MKFEITRSYPTTSNLAPVEQSVTAYLELGDRQLTKREHCLINLLVETAVCDLHNILDGTYRDMTRKLYEPDGYGGFREIP